MKKISSLFCFCFCVVLCIAACHSKNSTKDKQSDVVEATYQDTLSYVDDSRVVYPKSRPMKVRGDDSVHSITFDVEELVRDTELIDEMPLKSVLSYLVNLELGVSKFELEDGPLIDSKIRGHYAGSDSLAFLGANHPFWKTVRVAYERHRPLILSPDMIWLLISQGFANHVNFNSEEMRPFFVDFEGKRTLKTESLITDNLTWEDIFAIFSPEIAKYTGNELIDILRADFTTTTDVSRTVSEITIMGTFQSYFEFVHSMSVCGIPEITLEGTSEDWERVLAKAQSLKKYKLEWWIDEIEPILEKIIQSSKGNIDPNFWRKIFKIHDPMMCGEPRIVDGWIVKFFPYYATGKRCDLKTLALDADLVSEIHRVDLNFTQVNVSDTITVPLEIWAGFMGVKQCKETMALKPEIGWLIRRKENRNLVLEYYFEKGKDSFIFFETDTIPKELLGLKKANSVSITFVKEIRIPDEMGDMDIKELYLWGEASKAEMRRIRKLFPNTKLQINGK